MSNFPSTYELYTNICGSFEFDSVELHNMCMRFCHENPRGSRECLALLTQEVEEDDESRRMMAGTVSSHPRGISVPGTR